MVVDQFLKNVFLTHFSPIFGPETAHFQGILGFFKGPKRVTTGSKRAKNACLSIPNRLGQLLRKCIFDLFLTHFWSQNGPLSRHSGGFHGPKRVTTGSK